MNDIAFYRKTSFFRPETGFFEARVSALRFDEQRYSFDLTIYFYEFAASLDFKTVTSRVEAPFCMDVSYFFFLRFSKLWVKAGCSYIFTNFRPRLFLTSKIKRHKSILAQ